MQKTGIEWCHYVNNCVSGCLRGCKYCYARKVAENPMYSKAFPHGFDLTFHPNRVMEPARHKRPELIFADSMSDLFGDGVKLEWVEKTLFGMVAAPHHIFTVLTKSPENITPFVDPVINYLGGTEKMNHIWIGTSVDRSETVSRITELKTLNKNGKHWHLFVSFEPLLTEMPPNLSKYLKGIEWVIIGQQTKPFNHPLPRWVTDIAYTANGMGIPVFIKNNLMKDLGLTAVKSSFQKFPEEMQELIKRRDEYNAARERTRVVKRQ
jgi:protein gp37